MLKFSASLLNTFLNDYKTGDLKKALMREPSFDNQWFEFGHWFENQIQLFNEKQDLTRQPIYKPRDEYKIDPTLDYHARQKAITAIKEYMYKGSIGLTDFEIQNISGQLSPCQWQKHVGAVYDIFGHKVLLHGFIDASPLNTDCEWDWDLKTTSVGEQKIYGKYNDSMQHHMYMMLNKKPKFKYITYSTRTMKHYIQEFNNEDSEQIILSTVARMLEHIHENDDLYEIMMRTHNFEEDVANGFEDRTAQGGTKIII